jgi:hypothetical protein
MRKIQLFGVLLLLGMKALGTEVAPQYSCGERLNEPWQKIFYCENNSVRLEKKRIGEYQHVLQLVIDHQSAISHLFNGGGINRLDINHKGEFILDDIVDRTPNSFWTIRPRDGGHLVYRVSISTENRKMIFSVAYAPGETRYYIEPFVSYVFYNCSY